MLVVISYRLLDALALILVHSSGQLKRSYAISLSYALVSARKGRSSGTSIFAPCSIVKIIEMLNNMKCFSKYAVDLLS